MTINTGQYPPGVGRIHAQRPDVGLMPDRLIDWGPGFTAIGTHVQPLADGADEDCVIFCHVALPFQKS